MTPVVIPAVVNPQLLLGTDVLRGYPLELEVLLSTIRDHHLTIPYSFDDIQCLVAMVTGVSLAVVKEPYVYVEMVECEGMEVDGGGRATQGRSQLLQEILGRVCVLVCLCMQYGVCACVPVHACM